MYLIARKFSISRSASAPAVVTVLARLIGRIPDSNIAKSARMPIASTIIAVSSSIRPKPASSSRSLGVVPQRFTE